MIAPGLQVSSGARRPHIELITARTPTAMSGAIFPTFCRRASAPTLTCMSWLHAWYLTRRREWRSSSCMETAAAFLRVSRAASLMASDKHHCSADVCLFDTSDALPAAPDEPPTTSHAASNYLSDGAPMTSLSPPTLQAVRCIAGLMCLVQL